MRRIPTPQAAGRKVYLEGTRCDARVPMREIALEPPNEPVRLYDTSGPYTDPEADIDLERELGERPASIVLPWDFIDHGISRAFLAAEYRRALEGKASPPCPMTDGCGMCGVCG